MRHGMMADGHAGSGVIGHHAFFGVHGPEPGSLLFIAVQFGEERPCRPAGALYLPKGIATMYGFAERIERTRLGEGCKIGPRERRHTAGELFDAAERPQSVYPLNLRSYGGTQTANVAYPSRNE